MVTFKNFVDYFENLAKAHKDIDHEQGGGKSFFNVDMVDLFAGIKSSFQKDRYTMVLVNYSSTLNQGQTPGEKEINFFIVKDQSKGDIKENVEIRSKAETIAQEIIARIQQDCKTRTPLMNEMFRGSMDKIEDVSIIHTEFFAGGQKFIGVQCSFTNKFNYCPTIRENIFRTV